jgi:hypothetical protein
MMGENVGATSTSWFLVVMLVAGACSCCSDVFQVEVAVKVVVQFGFSFPAYEEPSEKDEKNQATNTYQKELVI